MALEKGSAKYYVNFFGWGVKNFAYATEVPLDTFSTSIRIYLQKTTNLMNYESANHTKIIFRGIQPNAVHSDKLINYTCHEKNCLGTYKTKKAARKLNAFP